jgi:hypothetical protein
MINKKLKLDLADNLMVRVGLLVLVMRGVLVMRDHLEVLEMRGLERIDLAKIGT